jgi:hypothetical protein
MMKRIFRRRVLPFSGLMTILLLGCGGISHSGKPEAQLVVGDHAMELRDTSDEQGRPIGNLKPGESVTDLGPVSHSVSHIQFGGISTDAPWIRIRTTDGQTGWAYAAGLKPVQGDPGKWLSDKTLQSFLGLRRVGQIRKWVAGQDSISDSNRFIRQFRAGHALRDSILETLRHRPEAGKNNSKSAYWWLTDLLPGFVFQWIGEGAQPYLFADYRYWNQAAQKTASKTDDQFTSVFLACFPRDSIESFFPVWTIQTGDNTGSSQLGTGQHLSILKKIDLFYGNSMPDRLLYLPDLEALKERLLDDTMGQSTTYWQPADKIQNELKQILQANLKCLTDNDRTALVKRFALFAHPAQYGIRLNLRGG